MMSHTYQLQWLATELVQKINAKEWADPNIFDTTGWKTCPTWIDDYFSCFLDAAILVTWSAEWDEACKYEPMGVLSIVTFSVSDYYCYCYYYYFVIFIFILFDPNGFEIIRSINKSLCWIHAWITAGTKGSCLCDCHLKSLQFVDQEHQETCLQSYSEWFHHSRLEDIVAIQWDILTTLTGCCNLCYSVCIPCCRLQVWLC